MSDKKIHIDQLFQKLKGYSAPVDSSDFDLLKDKMHDAAWKDKFADYEHDVSDIPDFAALPMATSDNTFKSKAAKGILLILLISIIGFTTYQITAYLNAKATPYQEIVKATKTEEAEKTLPLANNNQPIALTEKELNNSNSNIIEPKPSNLISNKAAKSANNSIEIQNSSSLNSTAQQNDKTNYLNKDNTKNTSAGELQDKSEKEKFKINPLALEPSMAIEIAENKGTFTFRSFSKISKVQSPTAQYPAFNANLLPSQNVKKFFRFYAETGIGLFSSANTNFDGKGLTNGAYFANLGASYGNFSLQSGVNITEFEYQTTQRKIQIYDSFPHRDINGDTIGWFKRNLRDSTINDNINSRTQVTSIPLVLQYKVLQINKLNLILGGGINLNLFNNKQIWVKDANDYLIDQTAVARNTNLGLLLNARIGYKINGLYELFGNYSIASNPSITKNISLKPDGSQMNVGIRYYIR